MTRAKPTARAKKPQRKRVTIVPAATLFTDADRRAAADYIAGWLALIANRDTITRGLTGGDGTVSKEHPFMRDLRARRDAIDRAVLVMASKAPWNPKRSATPRSASVIAEAVKAIGPCFTKPRPKDNAISQARSATMLAWAIYGMHTNDTPGSDEWDALVAQAIATAPNKSRVEGGKDAVAMLIEAQRLPDGKLRLGAGQSRATVAQVYSKAKQAARI